MTDPTLFALVFIGAVFGFFATVRALLRLVLIAGAVVRALTSEAPAARAHDAFRTA